jgi:hypothetical protein
VIRNSAKPERMQTEVELRVTKFITDAALWLLKSHG